MTCNQMTGSREKVVISVLIAGFLFIAALFGLMFICEDYLLLPYSVTVIIAQIIVVFSLCWLFLFLFAAAYKITGRVMSSKKQK
ncbi:MAG: hypothetical protein ACK5L6_02755 [Anaerorhabdus sp.]|uniref:hypothetical protein n=1 Tax=Anaerorhabdus sp. TaxID=1872524 RepID=UPI003A8B5529